MKFSFSSEQEAFRESLRGYLADRSSTREVRRLMETEMGWEREAWARMNAEMGLAAVRIPEAYGGQGFGFADIAAIIEADGQPDVAARLKLDQLHSPKHEVERNHRYIKWTEYPTCVLKRDPPAISVALLNSPGQSESIPLASVRLI